MPAKLFKRPPEAPPPGLAQQSEPFLAACSTTLFNNLQAGGVLLDPHYRVIQVNQHFCDILDFQTTPERFLGLEVSAIIEHMARLFDDVPATVERAETLIKRQQAKYNQEWSLSDGRTLEWDYTPIMHADQVLGHLWLCRDVTWWIQSEHQLKIQTEQLRQLACVDALTNVSNRRDILESAQRELRRARRSGRPLSLIMFDVDHFKRFNDTHGHAIGDEVLRWVARMTEQSVRTTDFIGRYGGEEFIILLPEADSSAAMMIAERVRQAICDNSFVCGATTANVSVSLGVTTINPTNDDSLDVYLRYADTALYAAKAQGRNRVIFEPAIDARTHGR